MAIAHVCLQCGLDLVRTRARPDPHYHLPLVICPRCATASARRVHPVWAGWRATCRLRALLCALVAQTVCVTLLSLLSTIAVVEIVRTVEAYGIMGLLDRVSPSAQSSLLLLALWIGAWLTIGLGHWRLPLAYAGWALWIALLLGLEPILIPLGRRALGAEIGPATAIAPIEWLRQVLGAVGLLAISLIGVPFGWFILGALRSHRRTRWRLRRKALRRGGEECDERAQFRSC